MPTQTRTEQGGGGFIGRAGKGRGRVPPEGPELLAEQAAPDLTCPRRPPAFNQASMHSEGVFCCFFFLLYTWYSRKTSGEENLQFPSVWCNSMNKRRFERTCPESCGRFGAWHRSRALVSVFVSCGAMTDFHKWSGRKLQKHAPSQFQRPSPALVPAGLFSRLRSTETRLRPARRDCVFRQHHPCVQPASPSFVLNLAPP